MEEFQKQVSQIRSGVIGEDVTIKSPLPLENKQRRVLYLDYTASGRAVTQIEQYITNKVLPIYGNTHTASTATSRQTCYFRDEARQMVKNYFKCAPDKHAAIFVGSGATGASQLLAELIKKTEGFKKKSIREEDRWGSIRCTACQTTIKNDALFREHTTSAEHKSNLETHNSENSFRSTKSIKLIVDPMAHHSSILPFRELSSEMDIPIETAEIDMETGGICIPKLEDLLKQTKSQNLRPVAILSAASNVTGVAQDLLSITSLVHKYDGLCGFDCAAVAGHRHINMSPIPDSPLQDPTVDFAFVSPHKMLGGPGTPGVLLIKKNLLSNDSPCSTGGGVVYFVTDKRHDYVSHHEDREEAGTPDILGSIRAGLVYRLHGLVDQELIEKTENSMIQKLADSIRSDVHILGDVPVSSKVGILSFNIPYISNTDKTIYLHHCFVTSLLNDLFGIQARGGCACAGPYAQWLLGMTDEVTCAINDILNHTGHIILRPGFVRIGVHYTMTMDEVDYVVKAIKWIASNGWKLLGAYKYIEKTGEWEYRNGTYESERSWLSDFNLTSSSNNTNSVIDSKSVNAFDEADKLLHTVYTAGNVVLNESSYPELPDKYKRHIWFATHEDFLLSVSSLLKGNHTLHDLTNTVPKLSSIPNRITFTVRKLGEEKVKRKITAIDEDVQPAKSTKRSKKDKKNSINGVTIPKSLRSQVGEAIKDYDMIKEGDKILVGLSGGKDSLALLHVLCMLQRVSPVKFEIGAATVNPLTPEYDPTPLKPYMESIGVPFSILSQPLIELAKTKMDKKRPSICSFCSRMKRGMLYSHMRKEGYNVLALGQHLDDLVESFVMSLFRNGTLSTMKANYTIQQGDIRVIRPLVYVRETVTSHLATDNNLPIIADNCPACFSAPKERHRIKLLLAAQEVEFPNVFPTVLRSIKPLIAINKTDQGGKGDDEDEDLALEESMLPCATDSCPL